MIGKKKRQYLNEFRSNLNGEYIYQGKLYEFKGEESERKKSIMTLLIFSIAAIFLTILSGILPGAGSTKAFYVIIPYVVEFGAEGFLIYSVGSLLSGGKIIREYIFLNSYGKIHERAMIIVAFAIIGFVGNFIYSLLNGTEGRTLATVVYGLLRIAVVIIALSVNKKHKEIEYSDYVGVDKKMGI